MDKLDGEQLGKVVDIESKMVYEPAKSVHAIPFVQVSRELIQKSKLSIEARMLIIYLISFNEKWTFYNYKIQEDLCIGRDRLRKAISELTIKGYIKSSYVMGDNGRLAGTKRTFSAYPEFLDKTKKDVKIPSEAPKYGSSTEALNSRQSENQAPGDQQLNITSINKTNINNNKIPLKAPQRGRTRSSFPKEFESFWFHYPKKVDKSKAFERFNTILSEDYSLYDVMVEAIKAQNLERRARLSKNLWQADPKGPAAWLRDKRWEDEVITNQEQLDEEVRRIDSGKSGISHKSAKFSQVMRESRKRTEAAMRHAGLTPGAHQQLSGPLDDGAGTPAIQQVQALLPGELAKRD